MFYTIQFTFCAYLSQVAHQLCRLIPKLHINYVVWFSSCTSTVSFDSQVAHQLCRLILKLHINYVVWSWLWLFEISLTTTWVIAALMSHQGNALILLFQEWYFYWSHTVFAFSTTIWDTITKNYNVAIFWRWRMFSCLTI